MAPNPNAIKTSKSNNVNVVGLPTKKVAKTPAKANEPKKVAKAKVDKAVDKAKDSTTSLSVSGFYPASLSGWKLQLGLGGGTRNFGNGEGQDHGGFGFSLGGGLVGRWGKHVLTAPKLTITYQSLNKTLGSGDKSSATEVGVLVGADYLYNFHKHFGVGGYLDIGMAIYNSGKCQPSEFDPSLCGEGTVEFNKNAQLQTLSNEVGLKLRVGLQFAAWNNILGAQLGWTVNAGMNPNINLLIGGEQTFPFSTHGFEGMVNLNVFRLVDYIRSRGSKPSKSKARKKGTEPSVKKATPEPKKTPKTVKTNDLTPAPPVKKGVAPKDLIVQFDKALGEVRKNNDQAQLSYGKLRVASSMNAGATRDKEMAKLFKEALFFGIEAQKAYQRAKDLVKKLEEKVAAMPANAPKKGSYQASLRAAQAALKPDRKGRHLTAYEANHKAYRWTRLSLIRYERYQKTHPGAEKIVKVGRTLGDKLAALGLKKPAVYHAPRKPRRIRPRKRTRTRVKTPRKAKGSKKTKKSRKRPSKPKGAGDLFPTTKSKPKPKAKAKPKSNKPAKSSGDSWQ